ncbi:AAA family ATPase [Polyangium aurulentum]|uniref:AAA family ATPase n=1 Tax=Polyangium aurulentum TaxID=2567896 RepID=UPI0010AE622D|nr:ATP-binding protein [Polyangium aurulentum]UQA59497.1 AAA family ATPase [Polyangium aurulentum]
MRDKSELLLRDEYARRFAIYRIAEMLAADHLKEDGPREIRIEQGRPEWDDLVERWVEEGETIEHRWQVKRQSTRLSRAAFEELILAMTNSGTDFIAHFGLQDLVKIERIGEVRVLRDLCEDRLRGVRLEAIDFDDLAQILTKDERNWVDAIVRVLASTLGRTEGKSATFKLLRRLHVELLYDADELERRAVRCLKQVFIDAKAAWQTLHAHVSAKPQGHIRFTAMGLNEGPLRDARRRGGAVDNRFDLGSYLAKLPDWLEGPADRIETGLQANGQPIDFEHVCDTILNGQMAIITGPSGCGKTTLLRTLARALSARGAVPVYAEAKAFNDHLRSWLDEAVAPLLDDAFRALQWKALAEARRVVVIVDGLEEGKNKTKRLFEELNKSSTDASYTLVLASRERPARLIKDAAIEVRVGLPDTAAKQRLFTEFTGNREIDRAHAATLLKGLSTPLEVELAAKAVGDLPEHPTAYQLFDAYVRRVLREREEEDATTPTMRLLVGVAALMADRFATTITTPKLRSLGEKERGHSCPDPVTVALRTGLLVERAGYASFRHDLFRLFFEADGLLLANSDDVETLAGLVARPRYHELSELILGALNEPEDAESFVRRCSDEKLLVRALEGHVGCIAERAAERVIDETLSTIREEWAHLPVPQIYEGSERCCQALRQLSRCEQARMWAAGRLLCHGKLWNQVISIIHTLDRWIQKIPAPEGVSVTQVRDEMIGTLYVFSSPCSSIISSVHAHRWGVKEELWMTSLGAALLPILQEPDQWSPGVAILIGGLAPWHTPTLHVHLPPWFEACWKSGSYHVRRCAAESLSYAASDLTGPVKEAIIDQLQRIWERARIIVGPMEPILQTLITLGVIKDPSDDYTDTGINEVHRALSESETEDSHRSSYYAFTQQFDEYVGGAYFNAIQALDAEQRITLLCRAAKGAHQIEWSEPATILEELLASGDSRASDAFLYWARVPLKRTLMDNEGVTAFIYANTGLGKLGLADIEAGPLPASTEDHLWFHVGAMMRYLHAPGADTSSVRFRELWRKIRLENPWLVCDALRRTLRACESSSPGRSGLVRDLTECFPTETCALAAQALSDGISEELRRSHRTLRGPHLDAISYTTYVLERFGNSAHIGLLDKLVEDPDWGSSAIDAIRAIRNRETGS